MRERDVVRLPDLGDDGRWTARAERGRVLARQVSARRRAGRRSGWAGFPSLDEVLLEEVAR